MPSYTVTSKQNKIAGARDWLRRNPDGDVKGYITRTWPFIGSEQHEEIFMEATRPRIKSRKGRQRAHVCRIYS